nr:MAG TPA: hypothetical protein [Caudoviricetes sp.]
MLIARLSGTGIICVLLGRSTVLRLQLHTR